VIVCDGFCICDVQGAGRVADETRAVVIGYRGQGLLAGNARPQPPDGASVNEPGGFGGQVHGEGRIAHEQDVRAAHRDHRPQNRISNSTKVILCPSGQLVRFDRVPTVLGDPAAQFGNSACRTANVATQKRWCVRHQFLDSDQVTINQSASVIRTEKVFSPNVGRSLRQNHRQHVSAHRRLHEQRTR
jgi:hypothetical protein